MSDVTSSATYIQNEEVAYKSAISEGLATRMAGSINYCLDQLVGMQVQTFTTPGSTTWTVPEGKTSCIVTACGGGGGGGDRSYNVNTGNYNGSAGGNGSLLVTKIFTGLTPGASITVVVGSGGAANTNGGDTTFNGVTIAKGGTSGVRGALGGYNEFAGGNELASPAHTRGGSGNDALGGAAVSGCFTNLKGINGQSSNLYSGGSGNATAGGGGGGGAGDFGVGANYGSSANSAYYGSGGGGGGTVGGASAGSGAGGYLAVYY
jgi:hypothetical protein